MKIREYKIRNLVLLGWLQEKLPKKYGREAKEVVDKLITKTYALRHHNLVDYLMTILILVDKYPELRVLLPLPTDLNQIQNPGIEKRTEELEVLVVGLKGSMYIVLFFLLMRRAYKIY